MGQTICWRRFFVTTTMSNKPTLVLLHGHGVGPQIWDSLQEELEAEYQVLKPDLSTMTSHTSVEAYAEHLYSRLAAPAIGRIVLIGHSMGGYVALALAASHPERIAGLVLVNSTAFADPDTDEQRAKRDAAKAQLQTEGSAAFVEKAVTGMFAEANQQEKAGLVRQTIDRYKTLPVEALLAGLQAIRSRPDRSALLADAPYPVLVLAGRHDKAVPIKRSQELSDELPNAQLVVLENSGHLAMLEEPEAVATAVKQFLNNEVQ